MHHMAMKQPPRQTNGTDQHERLVVGWFSFTCCEDSTILLTELLNDHLDEWKKVVEFRHMKALKTNNSLAGLDVAFIEGAISSESQAKEVRADTGERQVRGGHRRVRVYGEAFDEPQPVRQRADEREDPVVPEPLRLRQRGQEARRGDTG